MGSPEIVQSGKHTDRGDKDDRAKLSDGETVCSGVVPESLWDRQEGSGTRIEGMVMAYTYAQLLRAAECLDEDQRKQGREGTFTATQVIKILRETTREFTAVDLKKALEWTELEEKDYTADHAEWSYYQGWMECREAFEDEGLRA